MRLLPVIRLSLATDNTTSPERQFAKIGAYASLHDHEMVEITEADYDLDVSGSVSPFDRPGLGKWLKPDRLDQWDALCAAKLDRLTRSLLDFTSLLQWLEANGKTLIILGDDKSEAMDLTTSQGRFFAHMLVNFAQYEREVIGARVKEAYEKLVRDGKYTGGQVPFGYRPVKLDKNWGYEVDPKYGPLVAEMADRYLRYETLGSIARWLQESGVPSPKDVVRLRSKSAEVRKKVGKTPWSAVAVRIILSSPAVLGAVTNAKGEPLRDEQGMVIYRADALITRDQYERIQARLEQNPVPVRVNSTPLLQVAFCICGAPMHRTTTKKVWSGKPYEYNYYQCHSSHMRNGKCAAKRVTSEPLEEAVFDTLLELVGHRKLRTERLVPGRDYSEEIAKVVEQVKHLSGEVELGDALGRDVTNQRALLDAARVELRRLGSLKPEKARIERTEINQTFQQWWDLSDQTAHNAFLREQGVKVVVSPDPLPEDLALARPEMIFGISTFSRPKLNGVLYLGNLGELLNAAADLPVTMQKS